MNPPRRLHVCIRNGLVEPVAGAWGLGKTLTSHRILWQDGPLDLLLFLCLLVFKYNYILYIHILHSISILCRSLDARDAKTLFTCKASAMQRMPMVVLGTARSKGSPSGARSCWRCSRSSVSAGSPAPLGPSAESSKPTAYIQG